MSRHKAENAESYVLGAGCWFLERLVRFQVTFPSMIFSFEIDIPVSFPYIFSQEKIVSYSWSTMVDGEGCSTCHKKGEK